MKKEKQIGVRVGLPAFFALEVEDVYRHTSGAHRALAFPDFLGLLIGLGLEEYRRANGAKPEVPDIEEKSEEAPEDDPVHLFDISPKGLKDLFREFDEAMGMEPPTGPGLHLVPKESEEAQ
jgi:hypothetical protein